MFVYLASPQPVQPEVKELFARDVKCPVVYTFVDKNDNVLYVGKSTYFASRWSQHCRSDKNMEKVHRVILSVFDSASDAHFNETQMIVYFQPPWNSQGKKESLSRYCIDPVHKVVLNVMTKQLKALRDNLKPVKLNKPAEFLRNYHANGDASSPDWDDFNQSDFYS